MFHFYKLLNLSSLSEKVQYNKLYSAFENLDM